MGEAWFGWSGISCICCATSCVQGSDFKIKVLLSDKQTATWFPFVNKSQCRLFVSIGQAGQFLFSRHYFWITGWSKPVSCSQAFWGCRKTMTSSLGVFFLMKNFIDRPDRTAAVSELMMSHTDTKAAGLVLQQSLKCHQLWKHKVKTLDKNSVCGSLCLHAPLFFQLQVSSSMYYASVFSRNTSQWLDFIWSGLQWLTCWQWEKLSVHLSSPCLVGDPHLVLKWCSMEWYLSKKGKS